MASAIVETAVAAKRSGKITAKSCRIVADGTRAGRQRFVEVEENRLRHELSLPYGTDEQPRHNDFPWR